MPDAAEAPHSERLQPPARSESAADGAGEATSSEKPSGAAAGPAERNFDLQDIQDKVRLDASRVFRTEPARRQDSVNVSGNLKSRTFAMGDIHIHKGQGSRAAKGPRLRVSTVRVDEAETQKLRQVWVSVPECQAASEILLSERLVLIQGRQGVGKSSAAISILSDADGIVTIDPSISSSDLARATERIGLVDGGRYVIESLDPSTAANLSVFLVRGLREQLRTKDARLVMTVDQAVLLEPELTDFVVPLATRPDPIAVLRKHVAYQLGDAGLPELEDRYDLEEFREVLADRNLGHVQDISRAIIEAFSSSTSLADLLEAIGATAGTRVQDWFQAKPKPTLYEACLLVAVALLGGCTYATVTQHAKAIERFVAKDTGVRVRKKSYLQTRSTALSRILATSQTSVQETDLGSIPSETVRLANRWTAVAVVDALWQEYDVLLQATIKWLGAAGHDPDPQVRVRAAVATGFFATYDFTLVRERLLEPWARGPSESARAAADALGQSAQYDATAPLVLSLLNRWISEELSDYDLWWTAAVTYGGDLGLTYPSIAMDQLLMVLVRFEEPAMNVVTGSVVRLLLGSSRLAGAMRHYYAHLESWLTLDQTPAAASAARQAYAALLDRATDSDAWYSADYRSAVLTEAESATPILRACLRHKDTRSLVLECLRLLVVQADSDESMQRTISDLIVGAATGEGSEPTDRERLAHYLERWADSEDHPTTARLTLLLLDQKAINGDL